MHSTFKDRIFCHIEKTVLETTMFTGVLICLIGQYMTLIGSKQLSPFSGAAASPGEHKRELAAPAPLQDEVSMHGPNTVLVWNFAAC